ncbi:MAG: hypothetical protein NZM25_08975 [Leptospiraceae bacterium]|nr:hypothetical protein [Leptospiraceae bacterium]MDW8307271.1 hypothetical protein [Leptospiraceae bacterium]
MEIRPNPVVSYELLSLPMKIAQLQHIHNERLLTSTITNKVEAILESQRRLNIFA